MTRALAISGERLGQALSLEGEFLNASLSRAYAPGTPVTVTMGEGSEALSFDLKAVGSKRTGEGAFDVRFRLVNLTREVRAALQSRFAA